jgi:hypothetical protein
MPERAGDHRVDFGHALKQGSDPGRGQHIQDQSRESLMQPPEHGLCKNGIAYPTRCDNENPGHGRVILGEQVNE